MYTEEKIAVLQRTKEVLLEGGWVQDNYYDEATGAHCLVGAVRVARSGEMINFGLFDALESQIPRGLYGASTQHRCQHAECWNDAPGRTFNQVLGLIDDTIIAIKETDRG